MRICDRLKGSPDLATEILKKIDSSTVFVGDATPVGRGAPHKTDEGVESPGEALMNPNAAIELGYALTSQVDRERPNDHDTRIWVAPSSTVSRQSYRRSRVLASSSWLIPVRLPVENILGPCPSQSSCQSLTFDDIVASPVIDGKVLLESLVDAIAAGHFARVPIINGSNHNEFRLFIPLVFGFQDPVVPDFQAVTNPGTTPYSAALQILLATIVSPDRLPGVITQYPSGNTTLSANIALAAAATDARCASITAKVGSAVVTANFSKSEIALG